MVQAINRSGADELATHVSLETSPANFARRFRQSGVDVPWIGSTANANALNLAGPALHGTPGTADFAVEANPASKAFAERYQAAYHAAPDMRPA